MDISQRFDATSPSYLDRPGGRLAYTAHGDPADPLVLLVHGMGDRSETFRFLVPRLTAAGYSAVTLDVRGHGRSTADWPSVSPAEVGGDVVALLGHLGRTAVVLGQSAGCAAALWAAAEDPGHVTGLVLESGFISDAPVPWYLLPAYAVVTHVPWAWSLYYRSLYPVRRPDDLPGYLTALRRLESERGRMAALRGFAAHQDACVARIPEVRVPALVVMGSRDPDFPDPRAAARDYAEALGGHATAEVVEGAGHYPHADTPDETARVVLGFLDAHRA